MIIVKLMGGLGNQMFQYAAAKSLACMHGVEVRVDLSYLNADSKGSYTPRRYDLSIFKANVKIAEQSDLKPYIKRYTKLSRLLRREMPSLFKNLYVVERGIKYHEAFTKFPKNTYLDGFWQSEKYFENYREQIKSDFTISKPLPIELEDIFNKIKSTNSVSIHVRRGDYVTLKSANDFHGLSTLEYYQTSIDIISEKCKDLELFIFSDDIEWCRQRFDFKLPKHFIHHTYEACWDMFLMSNCKHNIIANSSFSWWGAWLNQNPNKIVIAPKNWFVDKTLNTDDLIPREWIRL
ncbi:MAG: alpha-1,2-fucosyltransferase [Bacteroidota bacterium]|nr:alpha-1,2-fucosyltransferase [Bacteroidota bacterium]